jgi:hypothetical protein
MKYADVEGGMTPGVTATIAGETGTITFLDPSPSIDTEFVVNFNNNIGGTTPTPDSETVAIPANSTPVAIATLVAAALNGNSTLTASSSAAAVTVDGTLAADDLILPLTVDIYEVGDAP